MASVPLSVVIIAKNEEDNMDDCLLSVKGWADEIVVVDDNSTDRTVEITKKYTQTIYHARWRTRAFIATGPRRRPNMNGSCIWMRMSG